VTTPDKPTTEPKTPEQWSDWALNSWVEDSLNEKTGSEWVTESIRRAQEQARRQAIEECSEICRINMNWQGRGANYCYEEIRALLEKK
jgi:hypothetical protein